MLKSDIHLKPNISSNRAYIELKSSSNRAYSIIDKKYSHPDQTVERIPPMQFQDDEGIVSK